MEAIVVSQYYLYDYVVRGVMTIGNIAPRAGIESTSLAFQHSVLTITTPRLPDVTTLPTPTCSTPTVKPLYIDR